MNCWICGNKATSGEHIIKASDLRLHFKRPSQKAPIYYHSSKQRNIPVGSFKSDRFKSKALLCSNCNNSTTQAYDLAWQTFHEFADKNWDQLFPIQIINLGKVFVSEHRKKMLDVHLYFVKLFGCRIAENSVPIPIGEFSDSILNRKAHPYIFLRFGQTPGYDGKSYAGVTPMEAINVQNTTVFANWFYTVGRISVEVIYSRYGLKNANISNWWHPRMTSKGIKLVRFQTKT
jgi:hypothetical protein